MSDYSNGPVGYGAVTMRKRDAVDESANRLTVEQRVVALDAHGDLRRAVIVPVPSGWQDASRNRVWTVRGAFPKVWVRFVDTGRVVPWPLESVFTDLTVARCAQLRQAP